MQQNNFLIAHPPDKRYRLFDLAQCGAADPEYQRLVLPGNLHDEIMLGEGSRGNRVNVNRLLRGGKGETCRIVAHGADLNACIKSGAEKYLPVFLLEIELAQIAVNMPILAGGTAG